MIDASTSGPSERISSIDPGVVGVCAFGRAPAPPQLGMESSHQPPEARRRSSSRLLRLADAHRPDVPAPVNVAGPESRQGQAVPLEHDRHPRSKRLVEVPAHPVSTLEDLAEQIPDTFATYDRYETETRALVLLNVDPARVSRLTRGNQNMLRRVVASELAHLDDDDQAGAVAVLHLLASSRTWLRFRDQDGLAPGEAGRVARRAALAVIADLRRDAPVH